MPYRLPKGDPVFPPPEAADDDGLLAVGGDFHADRLELAYANGIFPWPHADYPYLWFSPDPRFVLDLCELHIPRSLQKVITRGQFDIRFDTAFEEVMKACARAKRPGQRGTWILPELINGFTELHRRGVAHSAEAFLDGKLVGGLYGVHVGAVFCGESMFAAAPDASKVAFVTLAKRLKELGVTHIDCQQETAHLARFGAKLVPRSEYLAVLRGQ